LRFLTQAYLINFAQNKIDNDASLDDVRKDERELQLLLTRASASLDQSMPEELRDSIDALQRQVSCHVYSAVLLTDL
jgi:hypothetical protein